MRVRSGSYGQRSPSPYTISLIPVKGQLLLLLGAALSLIGQSVCQAQTTLKISEQPSKSITLTADTTSKDNTQVTVHVVPLASQNTTHDPGDIIFTRDKDGKWVQHGADVLNTLHFDGSKSLDKLIVQHIPNATGEREELILSPPFDHPIILRKGVDVKVTFDPNKFKQSDVAVPPTVIPVKQSEDKKTDKSELDKTRQGKPAKMNLPVIILLITALAVGGYSLFKFLRRRFHGDSPEEQIHEEDERRIEGTPPSNTQNQNEQQQLPEWPRWSFSSVFGGKYNKTAKKIFRSQLERILQLENQLKSVDTIGNELDKKTIQEIKQPVTSLNLRATQRRKELALKDIKDEPSRLTDVLNEFYVHIYQLYAIAVWLDSNMDDGNKSSVEEIERALGAGQYDLSQDTIVNRLNHVEKVLLYGQRDSIISRVESLEKSFLNGSPSTVDPSVMEELGTLKTSIGTLADRADSAYNASLFAQIRALHQRKITALNLDEELVDLLKELKNRPASAPITNLSENILVDAKSKLDSYLKSLQDQIEAALTVKKEGAVSTIDEKMAEYLRLEEVAPNPQAIAKELETLRSNELRTVENLLRASQDDAITVADQKYSAITNQYAGSLKATSSALEESLKAYKADAEAARDKAETYKLEIEGLLATVQEIKRNSQTRVDELEGEKETARAAAIRAEVAANEAVAQVAALREQIDSVQRLDNVMQTLHGAVKQLHNAPRPAGETSSMVATEAKEQVEGLVPVQSNTELAGNSLPPAFTRGRSEFEYFTLVTQIMQAQWADILNAATNNDARYFSPRILREMDTALYGDPDKLLGSASEYQESTTDLANIVRAGQRKAIEELANAGMKRIGIPGDRAKPYWIEADPNVEGEVTEDVAKKGTLIEILPGKGGYDLRGRALRPSLGRFYV